MAPVAGILGVILALGTGTGAYAYASDDVLPETRLYPLRERIELVEAFVHSAAPTSLAAIRRKHLERRIREVELMKERRRDIAEHHIERVTTAFEHAIAAGDHVPEEVRERHDEILAVMELQQAKFIQKLQDEETYRHKRAMIEEILRNESQRLGERIETLDDTRKERFENIRQRYEAVRNRLRFRLENGKVQILEHATDTVPEKSLR
jgi:hypothetical protein